MPWVGSLLVLALAACGDDLPTIGPGTTGTGPGTATADTAGDAPTTTPPADDTAGSSTGAPPEVVFEADLDLETTRVVQIQITQTGDSAEATVTLPEGFGVAPSGDPLTGPARIDAFPEADAVFYTARLSVPAQPDGPCADAPISLALSLHADGDAEFLAGGLTPYCGADTWHGVPVIEPLRISGVP